MGLRVSVVCSLIAATLVAMPAPAWVPFSFSTGDPDGRIATASRPDGGAGKIEIESADDFVLTGLTSIDHVTFTGLLPAAATVNQVRVEFYRVFPQDSDTLRTSGPPTFSTSQVPTRVNSPADAAFGDADSAVSSLMFMTTVVNASFTTLNSVLNGINPSPNQTTGGEGPVTGMEVQFDVVLTPPIVLPADHYFFIPQVDLTTGDFFWLSAPRPIVSPGTPFPSGFTDLQSWIRNADLDPDWLRVGTDIVGGDPAPTFNATFSLAGQVVADLSIKKRGPAAALVSTPISYTLDVSNAVQSSTADNVVVTDTLPAGVTYKGFSGAGWACVQGPVGTVVCTLASLSAGATAPQITLFATPFATGSLTNTATVSADETDPNLSDNTDSVVTGVGAAVPALGSVGLMMLVGLLTVSGLVRLRIVRH
jgi:uncharacterized repeat protein (TIGR01451 family)